MNTSSWGPRGWIYLHQVAHNYDTSVTKSDTNKKLYKNFFTNLKYVLPCIHL